MHLLQPWGLAGLALIVPVVLLYLLRLRRQELTIASVLFWERAIDDLQANAPFQRLRRNLLLYLQIAVIVAVAAALSRPFVRTSQLGGGTVVVVLDGSASMTAPEGNTTRFERARARVAPLIEGLARGEELMLVLATDRAEVLHPLSGDRRSLARALAAARPTDRPTDLRDALQLASSVALTRADGRVYLVSDAAVPEQEAFGANLSRVELVSVGQPLDNVGLTALEARRTLDRRPRLQVLLVLEASGPSTAPREVELELRAGDRLFDLQRVTVRPGRPTSRILEDLPVETGLLEVRLTTPDGLSADNRAFVSLGGERRTDVLLVGESNLFLDKALAVDPRVQVVKYTPAAFQAAASRGALPASGLALFSGVGPAGPVPLPALFLNCTGPDAPADLTGTIDRPQVVDWSRQHPVTSHVDFDEVAISVAHTCRPRPWAKPLVEAAGTPLLVVGETSGRRRVLVGFNLLDSDLPLRPGFPILMANALAWLSEGTLTGQTPVVRCGEAVSVALPGTTAVVTRPDGSRVTAPLADGRLTWADTGRVGVYRARAGEVEQTFAVNLLDAAESDLTPRRELRFGHARVVPPSTRSRRNREQWRPLVGLVLGLLLVEWWWYHRRG